MLLSGVVGVVRVAVVVRVVYVGVAGVVGVVCVAVAGLVGISFGNLVGVVGISVGHVFFFCICDVGVVDAFVFLVVVFGVGTVVIMFLGNFASSVGI